MSKIIEAYLDEGWDSFTLEIFHSRVRTAKFEIHTIYHCEVRLKNVASYHGLFNSYSCKSAINFGKSLIFSRFVPISMAAMVSVSTVSICSGEIQNTPPYIVKLTIFVDIFFLQNQSESGLMPSPRNDTSLCDDRKTP